MCFFLWKNSKIFALMLSQRQKIRVSFTVAFLCFLKASSRCLHVLALKIVNVENLTNFPPRSISFSWYQMTWQTWTISNVNKLIHKRQLHWFKFDVLWNLFTSNLQNVQRRSSIERKFLHSKREQVPEAQLLFQDTRTIDTSSNVLLSRSCLRQATFLTVNWFKLNFRTEFGLNNCAKWNFKLFKLYERLIKIYLSPFIVLGRWQRWFFFFFRSLFRQSFKLWIVILSFFQFYLDWSKVVCAI